MRMRDEVTTEDIEDLDFRVSRLEESIEEIQNKLLAE